jgi:hypothetical protein
MAGYDSTHYLLDDQPRTLFPLRTTELLIRNCAPAVFQHIHQILGAEKGNGPSFLPQVRCYASKTGLHLRRGIKLDPVAELFLYDIIYRNRRTFARTRNNNRQSHGYTFASGRPVPPPESYGMFGERVRSTIPQFKHHVRFDIASYFNSIYHHDLVAWFDEGRSESDVLAFGRFFREIAMGRSVDCLPQGYHPCKVIGSHFLNEVDQHFGLRSAVLLRFMDDYYLFDNSQHVIEDDFLLIQRVLGDRGLSLNVTKTSFGGSIRFDNPVTLDEIKSELLDLRRSMVVQTYRGETWVPDDDDEGEEESPLTEEQLEYLTELLRRPMLDESDAELVLTVIRDRADDFLEHLTGLLQRFPSLTRTAYQSCRHIEDVEGLADVVRQVMATERPLTEDQLFWLARITEDFLSTSANYTHLLEGLFAHKGATDLSRAKVLEIPHKKLTDMREPFLKGRSDWLAWAAAMGTRSMSKARRNHLLGYFAKSSDMNRLIADCAKTLHA